MDEAEKDRLRELIRSKKIKPVELTEEQHAEIERSLDEIRKRIVMTEIGPNRFSLTALSEGQEAAPVKPPPPLSLEAGCLFRGRLTKGIAMTLPEGSIVQSNSYTIQRGPDGDRLAPRAVETVGSPESREELWKRLRSAGATNQTVNVWRDLKAYERFRKFEEKVRSRQRA